MKDFFINDNQTERSENQRDLPLASQRDKLLTAYAENLDQRVSKVRIFGNEQSLPLDQVFVELSINKDYDRRPNQAEFLG